MRFRILLTVDKSAFGDLIPLNYQYELSEAIYTMLAQEQKSYTRWLHYNGLKASLRQFKLFGFSRLMVSNFSIKGDRLRVKSKTVTWYISFLPEKSTETFIQEAFLNHILDIGDRKTKVRFIVSKVEAMPPPTLRPEMVFETLSPLCLTQATDDGRTTYLSPNAPHAGILLLSNLLTRYQTLYGKPYSGDMDFNFQPLTSSKPSLIAIRSGTPKQVRMKGYMCKFALKLPPPLMKIAYELGLGEYNDLGFGFIAEEVLPSPETGPSHL